MGSLAEGLFCIRADTEGVQFSRERESEITGTDANVGSRNINTATTQKETYQ